MAAETDPVASYGEELYAGAYGSPLAADFTAAAGLSGWAELTGCISITPPAVEPVDVAAGHLKTAVEEYIPGQAEPGTCEVVFRYTEARMIALEALRGDVTDVTSARGRKTFGIKFPGSTPSGVLFLGYIKKLAKAQAQHKSADGETIEMTIKVSGKVTWVPVTT
jgi:hypothetical protein